MHRSDEGGADQDERLYDEIPERHRVEGLDDEEIDLIIAYVREQQETHGLEPYPPG